MAEHDELIDDAITIVFDWCHEEKPSPINNKRVFAMGLLHGEVLRLRELGAAPTSGTSVPNEGKG